MPTKNFCAWLLWRLGTRVYGAPSDVIEVFHCRELGALGATRRAIVRCAAEIGRQQRINPAI